MFASPWTRFLRNVSKHELQVTIPEYYVEFYETQHLNRNSKTFDPRQNPPNHFSICGQLVLFAGLKKRIAFFRIWTWRLHCISWTVTVILCMSPPTSYSFYPAPRMTNISISWTQQKHINACLFLKARCFRFCKKLSYLRFTPHPGCNHGKWGFGSGFATENECSRYHSPGGDWNHGWLGHINTLRVYPNPMRKSLSTEGYLYLPVLLLYLRYWEVFVRYQNRYPT